MPPRPPALKSIPKIVRELGDYILSEPAHELRYIVEKLIPVDEPASELAKMWLTLQKKSNRHPDDDLWVWGFLRSAEEAYDLPQYRKKTALERKELTDSISSLAKELSDKLSRNGLDCHLVAMDTMLFKGVYVYDDFGDKIRESIDTKGLAKVKFTGVLKSLVDRAKEKIAGESVSGNAGKNADSRRFIQLMADRNYRCYGTALCGVLAAAANALYETKHSEADAHNLLNRKTL